MSRMAAEKSGIHFSWKTRRPTYATNKSVKYSKPDGSENLERFIQYIIQYLIKDDDLANAKNGIYTWVATKDVMDGKLHLYAMRTRSSQEIGTLHTQILYYIQRLGEYHNNLHSSGEMEITINGDETKHILFNFQSGMFLDNIVNKQIPGSIRKKGDERVIVDKHKQEVYRLQAELAEQVGNKLEDIFPNSTIVFDMDTQLIEHTKFKTHPEMINKYTILLGKPTEVVEQKSQEEKSQEREFDNQMNELNRVVPLRGGKKTIAHSSKKQKTKYRHRVSKKRTRSRRRS